jgi:integrase
MRIYVGTAARKPLRRDIYNAALAPCGGLRVSELCDLQWSSIAFETGTMMCVAPRAARRQRIRSSVIAGTARAQACVISLALRVCLRARRPVHAVGVRQLARAGDEAQIASRSTRTCYGMLCAGQQGHRYPHTAGRSRPSLDLFDHALCHAARGPPLPALALWACSLGRTVHSWPHAICLESHRP